MAKDKIKQKQQKRERTGKETDEEDEDDDTVCGIFVAPLWGSKRRKRLQRSVLVWQYLRKKVCFCHLDQ